ncbi:MAG TPA: cupin domain-containing protein [Solirubrobacteraceae bacterium]|nr:cupin domain-containing protein [Solirubrobacteraceae bacterium]
MTIDQASVIVDAASASWESWPPDQLARRGDVQWKTLISAGLTPSGALTAGVARLTAGGCLRAHHHEQAEIYVILKGSGTVTIDGTATDVAAGTTVFIPGSAIHSIEAAGGGGLRFAYVLAADAFEDVTYVFDPPA